MHFHALNSPCSGSSAVDHDGLSRRLIKYIFDVIVKPFTQICNLSLATGTFPDAMKVAMVTPLFKSGNKSHCKNYRPISVLPVLSKILEKLFYNRLMAFIKSENILTPSQYGFLHGSSTVHAAIDLYESVADCLRNQRNVISVSLDLT